MDPDQTAGAVRSGSTLFYQEAFNTFRQTTKANICCDWHFKGYTVLLVQY